MRRDKTSGDPARRTGDDRREFLEMTLAATGLAVLPIGLQAFGQTKGTDGGKGRPLSPAGPASSASMAATAEAFLNSLSAEQRAKATFPFEDDQRLDWHFVPRARKGIPWKELDPAQRHLAAALLSSGLSPRGCIKANTIMSLEAILREVEQGRGPTRDPELYFFTVFGGPRSEKPWGWRVEGHHVALNYTVAGPTSIASSPSFFGANPAEVRHGSRKGLRTLPAEEDLARALLKSLDAKQRKAAVISESAPRDIFSSNARKAEALKPAGLPSGQLTPAQNDMLMKLLQEYATNMPADVAAARLEKLRAAGFQNIAFAWAGGSEPGQAHYYRIQGPTFLVEYDNIQNEANHIHSVWRDFNDDFGLDLLAMHHKTAHR